MHNFFLAGRELVQWNIEVLQANGARPLRLTVRHAQGSIVEYFESTHAALEREHELEQLLIAARGAGAPVTMTANPGMLFQ
jgi:DICT domain-containing protein